ALVCVPHLTCLPPLFPFPVGVNNSIKFYCEAKNVRGISVSRTGTVHIKVLPAAPKGVQVVHMVENNVTLAWSPGFTGHSDLSACTIQISKNSGRKVELLDQRVKVPPFQQILSGLSCYSNYSVRVCCDNEVGTSLFSGWLDFQTPEAGGHPANRIHNDISALLFINCFFVIGCAPNVTLFPMHCTIYGPSVKSSAILRE
ncbi:unnamed protein product, partial [Oncorhynchus mykiss]